MGTYFVHTQWYVSRPKVRGRTHAEWGVAEFFPRGYYPVRELGGRAICKCTPLAAASLGSSNCDLNAKGGLERGSELVPHSHLGTGVLSIIAVHISYRAKASTQLEKEKPPGHRRLTFSGIVTSSPTTQANGLAALLYGVRINPCSAFAESR